MKRYLFTSLIVLLVGVAGVSAQSGWTLTSAEFINTTLGMGAEDRPPFEGLLSPDGSSLVWPDKEKGFCLYTVADGSQRCIDWPDPYDRSATFLTWSPDSTQLAFTENTFRYMNESDIWTLDISTGAYTNHTDDHVLHGWPMSDENWLLDYALVWTQDTLYFFRSARANDGYTLSLYCMPSAGGEPEEVLDMTTMLPKLSVYQTPVLNTDATQMAVIVAGQELDDPLNGIWLIDLVEPSARLAVPMVEFANAAPVWIEKFSLVPTTLQWAGSGGLIVFTRDFKYSSAYGGQSFYYADLAAGTVTPIVDFRDLEGPADMFNPNANDQVPFEIMPRAGVVTPDGNTFLFVHRAEDAMPINVSAAALPPDGSKPELVGTIEVEGGSPSDTVATMGTNGMAYMYAYLMQFEQP